MYFAHPYGLHGYQFSNLVERTKKTQITLTSTHQKSPSFPTFQRSLLPQCTSIHHTDEQRLPQRFKASKYSDKLQELRIKNM